MKTNQSKKFDANRQKQASEVVEDKKRIQAEYTKYEFDIPSVWEVLKRLQIVLGRMIVALKYQFHKYTAGAFSNIKFPWFKLGVAAIVVFIFTQKDIQFTINMKNPETALDADGQAIDNEAGMAQSVRLMETRERKETPSSESWNELDEQHIRTYINRFRKVARSEMNKFGIPASIKMAQGILESRAGKHAAVKQSNNHFGVPMSGKVYESAWANWRAHSIFINEGYKEALHFDNSYKKWATYLQEAGYSKDRKYAQKLISLIEQYRLYELDEGYGL